ncbi:Lrp/AsnC family transcriptional regulator [Caenispirillum bisanense]|uniref:siroheme decarboxylase n=1 Tax=Caenispirillum bisanense TaxID=414052 RepID=A0A286GAC2_9PROT|nr:Lrp/AsnC family transcriptional regulator [Caenispirillum bisanense]SOD91924.1 transcriptional regulator, AsnC family [Caenispirillum bisanense]
MMTQPILLDATDRAIVTATQDGLPLVPDPYGAVADRVGTTTEDVLARMARMLAAGVIRRIGAVPNHYRLGFRANGMTVWDVDDARVMALGEAVGALPFVSHCYLRPRLPEVWPYNLFAMVHGHDRDEAEAQAAEIRALLGDACRGGEILYSTKILKKTGLRLRMASALGG